MGVVVELLWKRKLNVTNGYLLNDPQRIVVIALLLASSPLLGWMIGSINSKRFARIIAWIFAFVSVGLTDQLTFGEPAGTRMVLIIFALLFAMKAIVLVESEVKLTFTSWLTFATLWLGMRPKLFARSTARKSKRLESQSYFYAGAIRIGCGLMLIWLARLVWNGQPTEPGPELSAEVWWQVWLATGMLLAGLSLVVHFGLLLVSVGYWRWKGIKCSPLFKAPLLSKTLSEFWGKRWNLAFSEMTAIAVFRPVKEAFLAKPCGGAMAMTAAFVFSGLLHELAISVPVRTGFGFPMIYFGLHGVALLAEKRLSKSGFELSQTAVVGRAWTLAWILIPLPLLFHRPFLEGCIWPFLWPMA